VTCCKFQALSRNAIRNAAWLRNDTQSFLPLISFIFNNIPAIKLVSTFVFYNIPAWPWATESRSFVFIYIPASLAHLLNLLRFLLYAWGDILSLAAERARRPGSSSNAVGSKQKAVGGGQK
jgi:hypothetical protein